MQTPPMHCTNHNERKRCVAKHMEWGALSNQYLLLYNMSRRARYEPGSVNPHEVNGAWGCLREIERQAIAMGVS